MVTVFKNVSNIFTATGDLLLFGRQLSFFHFGAFGVMVIGAVMASSTNMEFTVEGTLWMIANW
jgi:GDP-mannose transporter